MMKIYDFKADDQDMLEEKTKQNAEAVKVSTSKNAANVNVEGSEVLNPRKSANPFGVPTPTRRPQPTWPSHTNLINKVAVAIRN